MKFRNSRENETIRLRYHNIPNTKYIVYLFQMFSIFMIHFLSKQPNCNVLLQQFNFNQIKNLCKKCRDTENFCF